MINNEKMMMMMMNLQVLSNFSIITKDLGPLLLNNSSNLNFILLVSKPPKLSYKK